MNDLPAIVAWIIAVIITGVVGLLWWRLRFHQKPAAANWLRRAIVWLLVAATLGPVIVVTSLSVVGLVIAWREVATDPLRMLGQAVGGIVFMSLWNVLVALLFFLLPYSPIVLLWARMGPQLGRLENSRSGLAVAAMLLALPAALTGIIAYGSMDQPFGFQGIRLLQFGLAIWFATSVSLFAPRILFSNLRPGIFGGDTASSSLRQ
jgi:hypothetical protein